MFFLRGQVCGRCGGATEFKFLYANPTPITEYSRNKLTDKESKSFYPHHAVMACGICHYLSLAEYFATTPWQNQIIRAIEGRENFVWENQEWEEAQKTRDIYVYRVHPKPETPNIDKEHWPKEILEDFETAQNLLWEKKSVTIILSTCRSVLEFSLKKLGKVVEEKTILWELINSLLEDGIITQPIADWAHNVRAFGNKATHKMEGTFEDAEDCINFLIIFLTVSFTLKEKIKNMREKKKP